MKQVVIVSCLFVFSLSAVLLGEEPLQRPKGLEPGDTIMLIADYVDSKESGWAWETVQAI